MCAYVLVDGINVTVIDGFLYIYIQSVPGGKDLTLGECSLGQTIPI